MKSETLNYLKKFSYIIILELVILTIFIMTITAIRFINADLFGELKAIYEKYVLVETDISLVLGGESQ